MKISLKSKYEIIISNNLIKIIYSTDYKYLFMFVSFSTRYFVWVEKHKNLYKFKASLHFYNLLYFNQIHTVWEHWFCILKHPVYTCTNYTNVPRKFIWNYNKWTLMDMWLDNENQLTWQIFRWIIIIIYKLLLHLLELRIIRPFCFTNN